MWSQLCDTFEIYSLNSCVLSQNEDKKPNHGSLEDLSQDQPDQALLVSEPINSLRRSPMIRNRKTGSMEVHDWITVYNTRKSSLGGCLSSRIQFSPMICFAQMMIMNVMILFCFAVYSGALRDVSYSVLEMHIPPTTPIVLTPVSRDQTSQWSRWAPHWLQSVVDREHRYTCLTSHLTVHCMPSSPAHVSLSLSLLSVLMPLFHLPLPSYSFADGHVVSIPA